MKISLRPIIIICALFIVTSISAQKKGLSSISEHDLNVHMNFLASDELKGRDTGSPELDVAAKYLSVQAERLMLKSADAENGYFQYYTIYEKGYDSDKCYIETKTKEGTKINTDDFFVFPAVSGDKIEVSGEVAFVGYGIKDVSNNYNDFEGLDLKGKIVLMMNRGPMNEDGTEAQFGGDMWMGQQNFQYKMQYIMSSGPKAVLMVLDPKSGFHTLDDMSPGIASYLGKSRSLKAPESEESSGNRPFFMIISRDAAEQIIASQGKMLEQIQNEIDETLTPQSFVLEGEETHLVITMKSRELKTPNVFGVIEGSDPVLKDEYVIYTAHFDHVGVDGKGGVFNGADDNASGTVALIEIAEAFLKEKKRPARSVGILWVSAEEVGLFGSNHFANHPLVPIENIAAVINLDMLGRTKTEEDVLSEREGLTVQTKDSVKVIGGLQSSLLMDINKEALAEMGLHGNYKYNNRTDPARYFFRSDHINFARKDIPILFYSTGTHNDYHEVGDEVSEIDYEKYLRMVKFGFMVGYDVANYKGEIVVDNPMSTWEK